MENVEIALEKSLVASFHLMWGKYSEPVRLIHKTFRIVAGNEAFLAIGGEIGVKCNATNPELHVGCMAGSCMREGVTKLKTTDMSGIKWDSYWVPVTGQSDYFVHFTNGMNDFIAAQMAAMTAGV